MHLETNGACLSVALLQRKNLPTPVPLDSVVQLVTAAARGFTQQRQK